MIMNRIYENQNLLSLQFVSFLVVLRTYQQPCSGVGRRQLIPLHVNTQNHNCTYNRLPEDEPSGQRHAEDIKKFKYSDADKSLALSGRTKLQRQKILMFIYPIYYHNWRNISTIYIYIYIYNKTSIKRNILTIKQNTSRSRTKDLSAPRYQFNNGVFCWFILYDYITMHGTKT